MTLRKTGMGLLMLLTIWCWTLGAGAAQTDTVQTDTAQTDIHQMDTHQMDTLQTDIHQTANSPQDGPAEDFVIASVLIADPGEVLYSTVGHACLRMQCPDHGLDYIFSYESEDASHKVLQFLAGSLKMGMTAVPTEEYLSQYRQEQRGVQQYDLQLPIAVKQHLWQVLDRHVANGMYLEYDYLNRGCAYSTFNIIKEALDTIPLQYGAWPEKFQTMTRRELTGVQIADTHPWVWLFLNVITNGAINEDCRLEDKVIMPADLLEVLQGAQVFGHPLLAQGQQLLPSGPPQSTPWFTPLLLSLLLLVFTLLCTLWRKPYADWLLLGLQTVLGLLTVYLVCFSDLVCTEWSWLIVPCNPLPLLFWKWRKHWALPYAAVIGVWIAAMLLAPHSLTDTPLILLALSLVITYTGDKTRILCQKVLSNR